MRIFEFLQILIHFGQVKVGVKSSEGVHFYTPKYYSSSLCKVLSSKTSYSSWKSRLVWCFTVFFSSCFYLLLLHVCKSQVNDSRVWDFAACVVLFASFSSQKITPTLFDLFPGKNIIMILRKLLYTFVQLHWSNVSV